MDLVLVYNSKSGSALSLRALKTSCRKAGVGIKESIDITETDDLAAALTPYRDQRDIVVAAYGGDGTISSVARHLVGSGALFAPLPGGTLNHFTKDLDIAQDIDTALANLSLSKPRLVDVGTVNDIIFLNNSSIGLYPSSLQTREVLENQKITKWHAAVLAGARAFVNYHTYNVTIENETFKTPFLFVGNNDYHLEEPSRGRTAFNEKLLSVYAITSANRRSIFIILLKILLGRPHDAQELKIWKVSELTIHAHRSVVRLSRDGELEKTSTPLHYKSTPAALTIIGSVE